LDEYVFDILDEYVFDILDEYVFDILDEYVFDILDEYVFDILDLIASLTCLAVELFIHLALVVWLFRLSGCQLLTTGFTSCRPTNL